MAGPVRVRRLTEQEGQKLQRIVRRGGTSTVRFRRAMMLLASAGGNNAARASVPRGRRSRASGRLVRTAPRSTSLDNLSTHKNWRILRWAAKNKVELCFTPTNASWANPIEAHFGPLRQFTLANSNHPNHTVQTRELYRYLRWRNQNARHPDVLAAQQRERARIRGEKGIRCGGRPVATAA
jgi:hypothetical protein